MENIELYVQSLAVSFSSKPFTYALLGIEVEPKPNQIYRKKKQQHWKMVSKESEKEENENENERRRRKNREFVVLFSVEK